MDNSNIDYVFVLNGIKINDIPEGWEEAQITVEEDKEVKGLLFSYSSRLTFFGDGYDILKNAFLSNRCSPVSCDIHKSCGNQSYELLANFLIFLNDNSITIFNFSKCEVSTQLEDNSFSSKISNNKSIKANFIEGSSKNGIGIDPVIPIELDFFNINTGVYDDNVKEAYLVRDVFKWFIEFMSDKTLSFVSNFFTNNDVSLILGQRIRENLGVFPQISYLDIFENLGKLYNLGFRIEGENIRIEPLYDLYDEDYILNLEGIPSIETGLDIDRFFANIKVGDSKFDETEGVLNDQPYQGFNEEEFYFAGECNSDQQLDLSPDWIYNSNSIEYIKSGQDSNDNEIFIVESFFDIDRYKALQCQFLPNTEWIYNCNLTNDNIISNRSGDLPGTIVRRDEQFNGFRTQYSGTVTVFGLVPPAINYQFFENIAGGGFISPPDNLYNDGTNWSDDTDYYNVPENGFYSFQLNFNGLLTSSNSPTNTTFDIRIIKRDSGGVFIENLGQIINSYFTNNTTNSTAIVSETLNVNDIFLNQNERIEVLVTLTSDTVSPDNSSFLPFKTPNTEYMTFETTQTASGSEFYTQFDDTTTRILINEFEFTLTDDQYKLITNNLSKRIRFTNPLYSNGGWITRLSFSTTEKDASFQLINYGIDI